MGLKDIIASNVDLSKVDTGVMGVAKFGILGNKILSDAKKMQEEQQQGKKPGRYCERLCPVNENCKMCVAAQERFLQLVLELEQLEQAMEQPRPSRPKMVITNCALCGAPYERNWKNCPYCDTPYPIEDTVAMDIPQSKIEKDDLIKEKAAFAYKEYCNFQQMLSENRQSTWKGKMPGFVQGAVNGLNSMANNMLQLTPEQIVNGARKHGVAVSGYLYGLADGTIKNPKVEQLEEESKRQQQYYQRNMEIERERQEKLRKINQERNTAMGNMVYGKTINWASANETKKECFNCSYYYGPNSKCTRTDSLTNSSGSCIYWK